MVAQNAHQDLVNAHFQSTVSYWKEIYERQSVYATIYQQRRDLVLSLVDKLAVSPESRILEIGCGPGLTTVALAKRGYVVEAIDAINTMVGLTRELAGQNDVGHRISARVGDVHHLAFPSNTFSLILAIGVTEWLQSLDQPMREIARVLKPGGYLITNADNSWALHHVLDPLANPALARLKTLVRRRFGRRAKTPRVHMYSAKAFDSSLGSAGLQKLEGASLGFGPFSFFNQKLLPDSLGVKLHHKLQNLADRGVPGLRSAGHVYIVIARKSPHTALPQFAEPRS